MALHSTLTSAPSDTLSLVKKKKKTWTRRTGTKSQYPTTWTCLCPWKFWFKIRCDWPACSQWCRGTFSTTFTQIEEQKKHKLWGHWKFNNTFHDIPNGWRRLLRLDTNIWPATLETNTNFDLGEVLPHFPFHSVALLIPSNIKHKTTEAQIVQMVPYIVVCVNRDQNQGELQGASPYRRWLTFLWTSFSEKQISPPGSIKSHIIVMYTGKSSKQG